IQNLEKAGIIKGYKAVVDKQRLGWECDAVVLCNADPFSLNKVLESLSKHENVNDLLQISGDRRILFRVSTRNNRELEEFITKHAMPLGLVNVDIRMVIGGTPNGCEKSELKYETSRNKRVSELKRILVQ
ncbi:MAG: Lrp/AsnC family transcriptional regulator, partial [Thermoplasmata archaeon]